MRQSCSRAAFCVYGKRNKFFIVDKLMPQKTTMPFIKMYFCLVENFQH